MKLIKSYKLFESVESIDSICKEYGIENYTINSDGSIDVDGNVKLSFMGLYELPLKFNIVKGDFDCSVNNLQTLKGAPVECQNFNCKHNNLENLIGSPKKVKDFDCSINSLTSLEGAPKDVFGKFDCGSNKLEKLDGCPEIVRGDFNCSVNKLVSLENGPKRVDSSYSCYWNKLKNLIGSPDIISGDFYCQVNLLDSLIGGPSKVFGSFHCNENELRDIEHIPYFIGNQFYCENNPFFEIWEKTELATLKNTKLKHTNILELFNYYDPIRFENNEWVCYSERLNAFLKEIGVDTFEGQLKFYKIK